MIGRCWLEREGTSEDFFPMTSIGWDFSLDSSRMGKGVLSVWPMKITMPTLILLI